MQVALAPEASTATDKADDEKWKFDKDKNDEWKCHHHHHHEWKFDKDKNDVELVTWYSSHR